MGTRHAKSRPARCSGPRNPGPLLLLALAGLLTACPARTRTKPPRTVTQLERLLGKHQDAQILRDRWVYHSPALAAYLTRLGKRLAARSARPRLDWTFRLLDQDRVSAHALAGGHVYVTRGLLAHLSNEAELAALLCHEIGHIEARHHLALVKDFWERALRLARVQRVRFSMHAHWIWLQSRLPAPPFQHQLEADELALGCLKRNGYPPRALLHLARTLQFRRAREELRRRPPKGPGPQPPKKLGRPPPRKPPPRGRAPEWTVRLQRMRRLMGPRARPDRPLPPDPTFLRRLRGLLVAPDPSKGVIHGRRYIHTKAGFQLDIPAGWTKRTVPDALMASAPGGRAHLLVFRSTRSTPAKAIGAFVRRPAPVPTRAGAWKGLRGASGRYDLPARRRARVVAIRARDAVWVVALAHARNQGPNASRRFSEVLTTLGPVTRPVARAAHPWRLVPRRTDRARPLAGWTACVPHWAALAPVRKMNQLSKGAVITRGRWLKCVARGPLGGR